MTSDYVWVFCCAFVAALPLGAATYRRWLIWREERDERRMDALRAEQRKTRLAEARSALSAITRYAHDMTQVQKIAKNGLADSAMPSDD